MNRALLVIITILIISGCHKSHNNVVVPNIDTAVAYKNIVYATDSVLQAMDVYLPANRDVANTRVIILIHGGGWAYGDKSNFDGAGLDSFFNSKGCAVVNMNYRFDINTPYPASLYDIGQVMDYIKRKSQEWKVNPDRICLMGRSAGSHLAMMYAYNSNKDGRIKAVIDGFGPTDLVDSTVVFGPLAKDVNALLGAYSFNTQAWHDASPLFYASTGVPTVIFQGTIDSTVYFSQSTMLMDSLLHYGVPCMFAPWIGHGHGWFQDEWVEWRAATYDWISQFL